MNTLTTCFSASADTSGNFAVSCKQQQTNISVRHYHVPVQPIAHLDVTRTPLKTLGSFLQAAEVQQEQPAAAAAAAEAEASMQPTPVPLSGVSCNAVL
jgi:hypothetical protein